MRYTFVAQDLFASKTVRPNIEFVNQYTPAACEILTKNLPIEYIIEKHTMFSFYGRFIKQDRKQKATTFNGVVKKVLDRASAPADIWTEGTTLVGTREMGDRILENL